MGIHASARVLLSLSLTAFVTYEFTLQALAPGSSESCEKNKVRKNQNMLQFNVVVMKRWE